MVELEINPPAQLRAVMIQENIIKGQRIREYLIEFQSKENDTWQLSYHGTSIGYK